VSQIPPSLLNSPRSRPAPQHSGPAEGAVAGFEALHFEALHFEALHFEALHFEALYRANVAA
jgi:hypothetical protein